MVDALGGEPGVHSARWAGPDRDFARAMREVEKRLVACGATTPDKRRARFVAVVCLASPSGKVETFRGEVAGTIVWPPRGTGGFGYDPDLPAGRRRAHLRRDVGEREARAVAPRPRARRLRRRQAWRGGRAMSAPAFAVYVHWPFCAAKCPYCDFNSHVRHQPPDQQRFAAAFAREIATDRRARPRPHGHLDLPRRRHAVADGARDRRRHPRRGRRPLAGRRPTSR